MVQTNYNELIICSTKEQLADLPTGYHLLLGFTSDTLLVTNMKQEEVIEWIIIGKDDNGYLVQAPDEDSFLDALLLFKKEIQAGRHPLNLFK
jgi:hypothetical protein